MSLFVATAFGGREGLLVVLIVDSSPDPFPSNLVRPPSAIAAWLSGSCHESLSAPEVLKPSALVL